jgi:peptide/nickel transport system ATP-binding protein
MYAGQIVERGPAENVTQEPAHPYTQLLVRSAPDPDNLGGALRNGGNGPVGAGRAFSTAAAADAAETGCPFSPRCPFAADRCRAETPPLLPVTTSRSAACWRLDVAAPSLYAAREGGEDGTS